MIRAPIWTAMPRTSPPDTSHSPVWSPARTACRVDDIGEEHRRQHPLGLARPPVPGEELLDLVRSRTVSRLGPPVGVSTRHFHEAGTGDQGCGLANQLEGDQRVVGACEYQRGDADGAKDPPQVRLQVEFDQFARHGWAGRGTFEARPPLFEAPIAEAARREHREHAALAPMVLDDVEELPLSVLGENRTSSRRNSD